MHITKGIALLTGLLLPVVAAAAPFTPAPFTIDNKGDKVNIQNLGNEHFSYYQTTDGHAGTVATRNTQKTEKKDGTPLLNTMRHLLEYFPTYSAH